jgi:hypothetical protein
VPDQTPEPNLDSKLRQNAPDSSGQLDRDCRFVLLKMEYEKAAERYENLDRALWQNFSYLSLLSAAILTFGSNQLETWATVFFAGCPLCFWLFVQFIPLDAYGRDIRLRLRDIEDLFNDGYFKFCGEVDGSTESQDSKPVKRGFWARVYGELPRRDYKLPVQMAHSSRPRNALSAGCATQLRNELGVSAGYNYSSVLWLMFRRFLRVCRSHSNHRTPIRKAAIGESKNKSSSEPLPASGET